MTVADSHLVGTLVNLGGARWCVPFVEFRCQQLRAKDLVGEVALHDREDAR